MGTGREIARGEEGMKERKKDGKKARGREGGKEGGLLCSFVGFGSA